MSLFCEINYIFLVSSIFLPYKPVKLEYDIPLRFITKSHTCLRFAAVLGINIVYCVQILLQTFYLLYICYITRSFSDISYYF